MKITLFDCFLSRRISFRKEFSVPALRPHRVVVPVIAVWLAVMLFPGLAESQIGSFSFSQSLYAAKETDSNALITVQFSGIITSGIISVDFATSDITAIAGVDYVSTNGTLRFSAGDLSKTFPVTIKNDNALDGTETVKLTLSNPTGSTILGDPSTAILAISDPVTQQVQFESPSYSVDQTDSTAVVTLVLTGATNVQVSVDFQTSDGTAKAGVDYISSTGTVIFTPGIQTNFFTVSIIATNALKTNQTVNLILRNPTSAGLGNQSNAVLTIVATSAPVVQFSAPRYNVHEHVGNATVTVVRFGDTTGDATVSYATSDGTAVNGTDYLGTSGTLSFASGDSSKSFSFQIVKYKTFQQNTTVNVSLSNPVGTGLGPQDTAVVTIVNDNTQTITFTNGDGDVVTLTLQRAGTMDPITEQPLNLDLSATDETSILTIKAKKAKSSSGSLLQIDQITGDGGCKVIDARDFDLVGTGIDLVDYLGTLKLHDILNGADVTAGGTTTQKSKISAHLIDDGSSISLGSRVDSLTAAKIGNVTIQAPSIGNLSIRGDKRNQIPGDFGAQVTLAGPGPGTNQFTLGTFRASGSIVNSVITIEDGNVGSVGAAQMMDSSLFVGYVPDDPADPFASGTFSPDLRLDSVNINSASNGFVNSFLAAPNVDHVRLRSVVTDNGGLSFGVLVGQTVTSLTVNTPSFRFNPKGANDQSLGDFHVIRP